MACPTRSCSAKHSNMLEKEHCRQRFVPAVGYGTEKLRIKTVLLKKKIGTDNIQTEICHFPMYWTLETSRNIKDQLVKGLFIFPITFWWVALGQVICYPKIGFVSGEQFFSSAWTGLCGFCVFCGFWWLLVASGGFLDLVACVVSVVCVVSWFLFFFFCF